MGRYGLEAAQERKCRKGEQHDRLICDRRGREQTRLPMGDSLYIGGSPMRAGWVVLPRVNWASWHTGISSGTWLSHLSHDVGAVLEMLTLPTSNSSLHRFVYST